MDHDSLRKRYRARPEPVLTTTTAPAPGVNGLAPRLSIAYGGGRERQRVDRDDPADIRGYGWRVAGLSAIHRCANGRVTETRYDPFGRLVSLTDPDLVEFTVRRAGCGAGFDCPASVDGVAPVMAVRTTSPITPDETRYLRWRDGPRLRGRNRR